MYNPHILKDKDMIFIYQCIMYDKTLREIIMSKIPLHYEI